MRCIPAAVVAGNTETSQRVVDVVFGALAKALPGDSRGELRHDEQRRARVAQTWTYYETIGGGSGAARLGWGVGRAVSHDEHAEHAGRGD